MSRLLTFLFTFTLFLSSSFTLVSAVPINLLPTDPNYTRLTGLRPSGYVTTAINLLFGASGIAAFIYLLMGSFQWITSGGDKEAVEKARRKMTSAMFGLALVFSAYVLMFIIQALFGIQLIGITFRPIVP